MVAAAVVAQGEGDLICTRVSNFHTMRPRARYAAIPHRNARACLKFHASTIPCPARSLAQPSPTMAGPSTVAASAHVPPPGPSHGTGPLRIGAYHIPLAEEAVQSWSEISRIICSGDLADLYRHDRCEAEYAAWREPIKAEYGDLETYIRRERLRWDPPTEAEVEGRIPGMQHFMADWESRGHAKCIPNDWPYGIPGGCGHYVVWSKQPMLHSVLFESDDTPFDPAEREAVYDAVVRDGVRGLTGVDAKDRKEYPVVGLNTVELLQQKDDVRTASALEGSQKAQLAHEWAGRHVREYVVGKWPEDEWETVSPKCLPHAIEPSVPLTAPKTHPYRCTGMVLQSAASTDSAWPIAFPVSDKIASRLQRLASLTLLPLPSSSLQRHSSPKAAAAGATAVEHHRMHANAAPIDFMNPNRPNAMIISFFSTNRRTYQNSSLPPCPSSTTLCALSVRSRCTELAR